MGVISVYPKFAGLAGKGTLAGVRTYKKVFEVITDDDRDGVIIVGNASGIPHKGDVYFTASDIDPGALAQDITIVQDKENQKVWVITATYSSHSGDPADDDHNPMVHPPDIHWSSWAETRSLDKDLDGKPFTNSAGQPIDPPFERRWKYPALTVVRNESTFPIGLVQTYWDVTNSDVFNGWQPDTVKVEDIRASSEYREAQGFFRVTYEFLFRNSGWHHFELDQGTFHLVTDGETGEQTREPIIMKGTPTTNPVPLDGHGDELSQADIDANNFEYGEWRLFDSKPFSVFGF